jgi:hypothetical protein
MSNPIVQNIIHYLAPAVIAFLTFYLVDIFKKVSSWIDGLPDIAKQILVLAVSYVLTEVGALLGVTLPTSIGGFDSTSIQALLSGLLAFALKHAQQIATNTKTAATATTVANSAASKAGTPQAPQPPKT